MNQKGANKSTRESGINRAFDLANFILDDIRLAEEVAVASVMKLETVARAQDRRLYYKLTGRNNALHEHPSRFRNLVILNDLHLLQTIVYDETEKYEKEQETNQKTIDEKTFLVHFIKHLVKITLKHNSFYVTIGLTRLLYNYSTAQAAEIYNQVVQNPSRVKDDYYWRSRKARLMGLIRDRFGPLISVTRVSRGEERFVSKSDSARYYPLVQECLNMFMPWESACPLPPGERPIRGEIDSLIFNGRDPDDEHLIEISRIHALMHINCFERIVAGLNYPAPDGRLELPRICRNDQDDEHDHQQNEAMPNMKLDEKDLKAMSRRIDEYHATRDRTDPEDLRILVNGREHCSLIPGSMKRVDLDLDEDADMIEVRTAPEAGNILLATHYIDYPALLAANEPVEYSTLLKGGQIVTFLVSPAETGPDDALYFNLGVVYRETSFFRAARLEWRRLIHLIGNSEWVPSLKQAFAFRYALPVILVILTIGGVRLYIDQDNQTSDSMIAINQTADKDISVAIKQPETVSDPTIPAKQSSPPVEERSAGNMTAPRSGERSGSKSIDPVNPRGSSWSTITDQAITTRSADIAGLSRLSGIRSILVKLSDQSTEGLQLVAKIEAELIASDYWRIASADEADAALVVIIDTVNGNVLVKVIDENDKTIWPVTVNDPRLYAGSWGDIAKRIVADLTSDATRR